MIPQIDREHPVPDTQIFGLRESHNGYRINKLCSSLTRAENRAAYREDEHSYLDRWNLTASERELILKRDFAGLLAAGGNIFFLIKLGGVTGVPIYEMGAQMREESFQDFLASRNEAKAV